MQQACVCMYDRIVWRLHGNKSAAFVGEAVCFCIAKWRFA